MSEDSKFLAVGIFVIASLTLMITIWLWFMYSNIKQYNIYQTTFKESIDGITINSVVKYNGVEVGKVKTIELDKNNPRLVAVTMNILSNVPISVETYSSIKAQGITGLSYIDLRLPNNTTGNKILEPKNTKPYPEIKNRTSFLYSLSEQAQSLTKNVREISSQVVSLLSNNNIQHLSNTLNNIDKISTNLVNKTEKINNSLTTLSDVLVNIDKDTILLNKVINTFNEVGKSLSRTSSDANGLITDIRSNSLQNINSVLLPNINTTVLNLNRSSAQLSQFLNTLNQNPTVLIRGNNINNKGPGEE